MSEPSSSARVALALFVALASVWAWWGWQHGGYFAVDWYPGGLLTLAIALALLIMAPWRGRVGGPAAIALGSLCLLGLWTLVSMLWSPARDTAFEDAQRTLLFAATYGVALWLAHLRGQRRLALLVAAVLAATVVALATATTLAIGQSPSSYVDFDGTLRFPLGYRNANAAFFLIAFWPTLILAGRRELAGPLRAALLACAVVMLDLAILSQSRGSALAAAVSAGVYLASAPERGRAALYLALVVAAICPVLPALLAVLPAEAEGVPALEPLRDAARAIALSSLTAAGAATGAWLIGRRRRVNAALQRRARLVLRTGAVLLAAGAVPALVHAAQPAARWTQDRYHEFRFAGARDFTDRRTRFVVDAGSGRYDFWRVAWLDWRASPLLGLGAGGYPVSYVALRRSREQVQDPHSVELRTLAELGLPGGLLFAAFVVAAFTAAARARHLGPGRAAVGCAALASGACWLVQASVDWFWAYPAVTAPVMGLLGAAAGPSVVRTTRSRRSVGRNLLAILTAAIAAAALPAYLSVKYTEAAYDEWWRSPRRAYADLDRAQRLNPLATEPLVAEGTIAQRLGEHARSRRAFRAATVLEPDSWGHHYLLAMALRRGDPAAAIMLARARRLNPGSAVVRRALGSLPRAAPDRYP